MTSAFLNFFTYNFPNNYFLPTKQVNANSSFSAIQTAELTIVEDMAKAKSKSKSKAQKQLTKVDKNAPANEDPELEVNAFMGLATGITKDNGRIDYEDVPRSFEKKKRKAGDRFEKVGRLPIKTPDGFVREVVIPRDLELESEISGDSNGADGFEEGVEFRGFDDPVSKDEIQEEKPKVSERQRILDAKEELANIAMKISEDPDEHIGLLKRLKEISEDENATIQKLGLATEMAVYKDVIPGYRIRPLTGEEQKVKVTKEVKNLRNFEQTLVGNYQLYIQRLARLAKVGRIDENENIKALGKVALNCVCGLLVAVPHFNFRGELLKILVERLSTKNNIDEGFAKCRETIEKLFREDESGNASLEAVRVMVKIFKSRKYHIDESVLNTFLSLRLLSELAVKASTEKVDRPDDTAEKLRGKKRKREKEQYRTKKQRKLDKDHMIMLKELDAASAIVSHEEREKLQEETLKLVFVTYFRILKERPQGLMAATLEGLAKYAHLINIDFFGDLLEALRELITDAMEEVEGEDTMDNEVKARNATRESLLCVITAFALLTGQGEEGNKLLPMDLSFFTNHLFSTLLPLALNPDIEYNSKSLRLSDPHSSSTTMTTGPQKRVNLSTEIEMTLKALTHVLLSTNPTKIPPSRVLSFTKRLLTLSLHTPEKSCIATLSFLNEMSKKHYRKISGLFTNKEEEKVGEGNFGIEEMAEENLERFGHAVGVSTAWEMELLRGHFSPKVRGIVKTLGGAYVQKEGLDGGVGRGRIGR